MTPALFTMMSSRPNARTAKATIRRACADLATSVRTKAARPPAAAMRRTVSRPCATATSATATAAPSAASRIAVARPMPEAAPVTSATLSLIRIYVLRSSLRLRPQG